MTDTHFPYGRTLRTAAVRNRIAAGDLALTLSKVTFYEKCTVIEGAAYADVLDTGAPTLIPRASVTFGDGAPIASRSEVGSALGKLRQFTLSTPPGDETATTIRVEIAGSAVVADLD